MDAGPGGERWALATGGMSLEAVVAAVVRAEQLGYEIALVGEGALETDAFVTAAAALTATRRIRVGPGVVAVHERHPVGLARAAAALDRLAPGRALLGVGRGERPWVADALGLPWTNSQAALEDTLRICRALLGGRAAAHDGSRWSAHCDPPPTRAAASAHVPLALAAVGPRTLRLGGALADLVLLNYGASPEYVRWAVERVREGAIAAGRDPAAVDVLGYVLVARTDLPDGARRLEVVRRTVSQLLAEPGQGEALAAPTGGLPAALDDMTLGRFAAVGDGRTVAARLAAYRDAGLRSVVLMPSGMRAVHGDPSDQGAGEKPL